MTDALPGTAGVPVRRPAPSRRPRPGAGAAVSRSAQVLAFATTMDALCELDQLDRAALRLVYLHGRTQAQVAGELRVPLATVRTAVARGLRQLAARLTAVDA